MNEPPQLPPPLAFTADDSGRSALEQFEDFLVLQGMPIDVDRESYPSMGPYIVSIGGDSGPAGWLYRVLRQVGPPDYEIDSIDPGMSMAWFTPHAGDIIVVFPAADFPSENQ